VVRPGSLIEIVILEVVAAAVDQDGPTIVGTREAAFEPRDGLSLFEAEEMV